VSDDHLDALLLAAMEPGFLKIARIVIHAHDSLDDWSEAALAASIDRLVALEQRGLIEIAGDPRHPHESEARLLGT
jgi:hypothetical protein